MIGIFLLLWTGIIELHLGSVLGVRVRGDSKKIVQEAVKSSSNIIKDTSDNDKNDYDNGVEIINQQQQREMIQNNNMLNNENIINNYNMIEEQQTQQLLQGKVENLSYSNNTTNKEFEGEIQFRQEVVSQPHQNDNNIVGDGDSFVQTTITQDQSIQQQHQPQQVVVSQSPQQQQQLQLSSSEVYFRQALENLLLYIDNRGDMKNNGVVNMVDEGGVSNRKQQQQQQQQQLRGGVARLSQEQKEQQHQPQQLVQQEHLIQQPNNYQVSEKEWFAAGGLLEKRWMKTFVLRLC